MDIIEQAENILKTKQVPLFEWDNPENHDIVITGCYFTGDGKMGIEYAGK